MANLRDWLQLFRSHTSPLEMIITVCGSALAVGSLWDVRVLLFLIFGWLYHNAGYGHNSAEDFIQGYDKDDPNKKHHPLHRGVIDPMVARGVCVVLILSTFLYGAIISDVRIGPLIALIVLTSMGFLYNIRGKALGGKFIPIAVAHSLLFTFAYLGSGGAIQIQEAFPFVDNRLGAIAVLGTGYLIFQIIYQIMIEGDLKDIDMDEASLLRDIGVRIEDEEFRASTLARSLSISIKLISISILFSMVYLSGSDTWHYLAMLIFTVSIMFQEHRLMCTRPWNHSACLKDMALMEILSAFALVLGITPIIGGWVSLAAIMIASMVYFIAMNRFLWGTTLKPKV